MDLLVEKEPLLPPPAQKGFNLERVRLKRGNMLQSPLYIDKNVQRVQPPCESLGLQAWPTPRWAAGGFEGSLGHEGPPKRAGVTVRGLTRATGGKGDGATSSPGAREGGGRGCARRWMLEMGMCPPSPGLEGREAVPRDLLVPPSPCDHVGKGAPCAGGSPAGRRGQLASRWAHRKMPSFPPPPRGAVSSIEGEGCPVWHFL